MSRKRWGAPIVVVYRDGDRFRWRLENSVGTVLARSERRYAIARGAIQAWNRTYLASKTCPRFAVER